jgi:5-(carboxyamino)imidazole ribonucleotide synthase
MSAATFPDLIRPAYVRAETPPLRLGILGGGQLAKMTAQAASQLGFEVVVLERNRLSPAAITATHAVVGDWNDPSSVLELAAVVDVVTLENEFVDATALEALERRGHRLHPSSATIRTIQDKLLQKEALARAGLPVPRFRAVSSFAEGVAFARAVGWPIVLKRRRNSYDGKGNATARNEIELAAEWKRLAGAHLHGGDTDLYSEEFCPFAKELAVMVIRDRIGNMVTYPVVETIQRDHICHAVLAPAPVEGAIAERAAEIARHAIEMIDGVGAFGVELFLTRDGGVLVNELAPRVHNSGHYTIEACETSQFENHVRAVFGLPLGATAMRAPAACMVNLLGAGPGTGVPRGLAEALQVPGAAIHVYGKSSSAKGRKMGHVTALGQTLEEAHSAAREAAERMTFGRGK